MKGAKMVYWGTKYRKFVLWRATAPYAPLYFYFSTMFMYNSSLTPDYLGSYNNARSDDYQVPPLWYKEQDTKGQATRQTHMRQMSCTS